ncbi:group III truncated hemoglobin [Mucilaginibacter sp. 14171R-50]|uniref:group III truncated hemoglobin n=1 Tax=Mucilaginibacter sp. 14171R-50 TaxID=2703789 RepID=UPI00138D525D|nr:group III truncated hemoglobin [Mucilaginibacter sp. 14171R-50]QHS56596.1 group III truncated hemoglobin [Mucilaginibacter sp. 14171R-50]
MKKEIENIEDIKVFVDDFYTRVRTEELIGPIFMENIEDWRPHLDKMYAFWNAALFGVHGFRGNPFAKHAPLNIGRPHFERWLELFYATIDEHFEGFIAEDAKKRAELMASMFLTRLQQLNGNSDRVIV